MTCIAAICDNYGTGYIACDSLGSNYHTKNVYKTPKIFQRDRFLFGFTGSYRMGQLLQYKLSIPSRKVEQDLDSYLHIDFVDAVRTTFTDGGLDAARVGEFLLIAESRIFTMQNDYSLLESMDEFEACGSGEDYARAAIHTLVNHDVTDCEAILEEAIETAGKYTKGVGGPISHLRIVQ